MALEQNILRQTITIFNGDGNAKFRSILKNVRVGEARKGFAVAATIRSMGMEKTSYTISVLIDPKTTKGLSELNGKRKSYLDKHAWQALPVLEKPDYWTLNAGDWLCCDIGSKTSICPNFDPEEFKESEFKAKYHIKILKDISYTIDEKGLVHHFEVSCE
jgi:hypothetical protein